MNLYNSQKAIESKKLFFLNLPDSIVCEDASRFINMRTPINFICKKCNNVWNIGPAWLSGCKRCATNERSAMKRAKSKVKFLSYLKTRRDIDIVDDSLFIDMKTSIEFSCNYGHSWLARPNNIEHGQGCRKCKCSGAYSITNRQDWENVDGYLYKIILTDATSGETFNKVGITSNIDIRLGKSSFSPYEISEIASLEKMTMGEAFDIERIIINRSKTYKPAYKFGGHTECYID